MNRLFFKIIIIVIIGLISACEGDELITNDIETARQDWDNYTLLTGKDLSYEFSEQNTGEIILDFKIIDTLKIEKDGKPYLQIEIEYQACDSETRFDWIGRTAQLRGQPAHIFVFVRLTAGKECESQVTDEKTTDLFLLDLYDIFNKDIADQADFTVQSAFSSGNENDDKKIDYPMPGVSFDPGDF